MEPDGSSHLESIAKCMMQLAEQLLRVGLSRKEAKVYLAVLELGMASAHVVARKAHVPRATTYTILRQLVEKGLITLVVERGEHRYAVEHPVQLQSMVDVEKTEVERRAHLVRELMPRLTALYNAEASKPKIRYFEGIEGMNRLRAEFSAFPGDMIQILAYDTFLLLQDADHGAPHHEMVSPKEAHIRSILVTDRTIEDAHHDIVCIPPEIAPIQGEVTVLDDRVVLFSFASGIIAIEITSKTIADTLRATLEFAWRYVKTL